MSGIFGGSKSTSTSSNQAYPWLQGQYGGQVGTGTQANSMLGSLLGVGDPAAGSAAFDNYKNSTGYASTMKAGTDAISGNAASRGLLSSGATLKGISKFGQDTNQGYFQNYLQNLLGLSGQGLQAGGLIGNAGQTSTSKSSSKPGIGGFIGSLAAGIPSDRRLKTDIAVIGEASNGLPIYSYRYNWDADDVSRTGYMADDVALVAPYALGPDINGYKTVRYDMLPALN